jgi:hypothetical protein
LGNIGPSAKAAIPALEEIIRTKDGGMKKRAADALQQIKVSRRM